MKCKFVGLHLKKRKKVFIKIISMLCIVSIFMGLTKPYAAYAAANTYYDYTSKKTVNYTGTPIKFLCNNYELPINTFGILDNGTALGPYEDIFKDYYGVSASENGNKLTLKYNGTTIKLTLGSKTAYINDKKTTMSVAPRKVKYNNSGKVRILVPTRFVSEAFGFTYAWKSNLYTVSITKNINMTFADKKYTYSGIMGKASIDGVNIALDKNVPVMIVDNNALAPAYRIFKKGLDCDYKYDSSTGVITLSKGDINLQYTVGSNIAEINGNVVECPAVPQYAYIEDLKDYCILVPFYFTAKAFGYNYNWNGTTKTCEITRTDNVGIYENTEFYNYITTEDVPVDEPERAVYSTDEAEYYYSVTTQSDISEASMINKADIDGVEQETDIAWISTIYKNNSSVPENVERYCISLNNNTSYAEVVGINDNSQLVINMYNTLCAEKGYYLSGNYVKGINTYSGDTVMSVITFDFSSVLYNYDVRYNEDRSLLYVTVFKNYLTDVKYGVNESGTEFVKISALYPIDAEMFDNEGCLSVIVNNTCNLIGNKSGYFDTANFESLSVSSYENGSIINIYGYSPNLYDTHVEMLDNEMVIYFTDNLKQQVELCNISRRYVYIPLPAGISYDDIITEDKYYNKQIVLKLYGDYRNFYDNKKIENFSDIVSNINVAYSKNYTVITLTTDTIQTFWLEEASGGVRLIMDKPSNVYDKIVVLDAGHGDTDPGAVSNGVQEKDLNFKILNVLMSQYFDKSDIKFYYTRVDDTLVNLYDRAAMAEEIGADFFVSLHMNANNSSAANGTGVYYCVNNNTVSSTGFSSRVLAKTFSSRLSQALGTKNNGDLTANFVVISANKVPAVLIELAFLTNASNRKMLTTASKQNIAAKTIFDTICDMYDIYFK